MYTYRFNTTTGAKDSAGTVLHLGDVVKVAGFNDFRDGLYYVDGDNPASVSLISLENCYGALTYPHDPVASGWADCWPGHTVTVEAGTRGKNRLVQEIFTAKASRTKSSDLHDLYMYVATVALTRAARAANAA